MREKLLEKANKLPMLPGVYIMLDATGQVIYVGKAKKLKNRVTSYFRGSHLPKVEAMVQKVNDFNVIVVNSEFESLILENSLIKQHQPHYNILLKDDKSYPYLVATLGEEYPRLIMSRKREAGKNKYYGPYSGANTVYSVISALRKVIPAKVHLPCYIVIIATFVTVVQMVLQAFVPALYKSLGVYLALIVVNCIILGRAEMFACKNNVVDSALDGIGMGIG